jgi:hypothetical protein
MWMLVLAFGLGAYAGAAWVLSTAAKAYGQRELSFWNAVSALVVARLATKGLSALLPKQDALTNIAISMSVYGAILVGVLWLWCGLSLLRALGIGLALTLALLIGTVVVVATLL